MKQGIKKSRSSNVKRRLFIDATITASFLYYGETKTINIPVNGLVNVSDKDLDNLDAKLILEYGEIVYNNHNYTKEYVNYSVMYRAINSI